MKKKIFFSVIFIAVFKLYAQTTFQKGYFITKSGEKIDCLIKNEDWRYNPTKFTYQLLNSDQIKTGNIETVQEFSIPTKFKYVKKEVDIDKSSDGVENLSTNRTPSFQKEILFLNHLVQGEANLFSYYKPGLQRFFYDVNDTNVKQLIYKRYKFSAFKNGYYQNEKIAKNERFKQQLLKDLNCNDLNTNSVKRLDYSKQSLVNYFVKYNTCKNPNTSLVVNNKKKKNQFHLYLKGGVSNTSLELKNPVSVFGTSDFGSKIGFRIGAELEYILPFNNDKWGLFIKPTYQSFSGEVEALRDDILMVGDLLVKTKVDYSSIEVPVGVRHYFFLNKNSKIFANIAYVADFSSSDPITFSRENGDILNELEINPTSGFAFGFGFRYKKFSIELEYIKRDIINAVSWNTSYSAGNIILGYTIF
ncbi:outer membrane beta-barrel protein [Tenacibaculum agarivorans]|uniref:outer membrane beta-barrel protein n=1 Tax=Tenacibaculum agarivorans TaxID=1908389 RepID=UPI00094B9BC6|nr:hypothetical protein [Tenacibaculum agarivorans]